MLHQISRFSSCRKSLVTFGLFIPALAGTCLAPALAQKYYADGVITPKASRFDRWDKEHAHANVKILRVATHPPSSGAQPLAGTGLGGSFGPSDLHSFYKIPATAKGSGILAIVDAYDDPYLVYDFNYFAASYGLPQETGSGAVLSVIYEGGVQPPNGSGSGWDLEESLDTQIAHAMAPNAQIVLIECQSNSNADLYSGVEIARSLQGVKEISMSWSGSEFWASSSTEAVLTAGNGINFAATGDKGAFYSYEGNYESYPASSPNVVACGGTTTVTNTTGKLVYQLGWEDGGGGPSAVFAKPYYQSGIANTYPTYRSTPDLATNSDPDTPFGVINTSYYGSTYLFFEGGTSESAPLIAAIQNVAGTSYSSTQAFLAHLYGSIAARTYTTNFSDVKYGYNGFYCLTGYDMVTGLGTPKGINGM